jgi:hypothetical protein
MTARSDGLPFSWAETSTPPRHPRSRAELEEALRSAAEETDRLTALASDLLLIARSDQGGLPVNPETLSSGEVLATVADRFSGRAAEVGRRIEVVDGEVAFDGDPKRIEQLPVDQTTKDQLTGVLEGAKPALLIGKGHYYVGGFLCENDDYMTYNAQPGYPVPGDLTFDDGASYLLYLDVWERHVTAYEDENEEQIGIREVALRGPDTGSPRSPAAAV